MIDPNTDDGADLVQRIDDFEAGRADEGEVLRLFAFLIRTGHAWTLQGSYGRAAYALIMDGVISPDGVILKPDDWMEMGMKRVMDAATAEHFYAWLERTVAEDEQHRVEHSIHAFLADGYADLIDKGRTWTEIRELAERYVLEGEL